jgi:hypothetical protein
MIFSENRFPLFRIMLYSAGFHFNFELELQASLLALAISGPAG